MHFEITTAKNWKAFLNTGTMPGLYRDLHKGKAKQAALLLTKKVSQIVYLEQREGEVNHLYSPTP